MEWGSKKLELNEVRDLDLVNYLSSLGFEPAKATRNGVDFYYLSPLRMEAEPSFHVNRKLNKWFDHGLGKGGNIIDFGMQFYGCTLSEFLNKINGGAPGLSPINLLPFDPKNLPKTESRIVVIKEIPLFAYPLINYLHQRHIPMSVAERYCCELHYEMDGHNYYGIGFKNNLGGYEIRNAYVKQSSAPKDITTIGEGSREAHVFEGFMDFLSWKTLNQNETLPTADFIILNGAAFFEKARPSMEQHETIRLWLDQDTTGKKYTEYALSLNKGYRDESVLYKENKDLNDWLCQTGISTKKQIRQRIG